MSAQQAATAAADHYGATSPRGGRSRAGGAAVRAARAVGYLRRSTDRQEQSIPDQQRALERFAAEQGFTILRWYTDDAISGTSSLARKAFQELIADAQRPGCDFGVVVVYDVKRFGRVGNDEAGYYRHLLRTAGVEVLYATEGFSGGETDDLLRPVKQWQARQESKDLSKVTIRGLLSKSEGGWWLGGVPPHGYDLRYENDRGEALFIVRHNPDGTKSVLNDRGELVRTLDRGESLSTSKRDRAKLVPGDPERVETIRTIFRLYSQERKGLKAIADHLNCSGIATPRGAAWSSIYAGQWRDSTVRAILVNPLYTGDMVWNRRTDARFHQISGGRAVARAHHHGARLVPNDRSDWVVVRDTHEGLVSRRTWELAQEVRQGRPSSSSQEGQSKPVGGWTGARSRFILSGLCRCALCGGRYQGVTRTKGRPRKDGSKVRTFSYACGSYIAKGTGACQFNPVPQGALETAVIEAVLGFYRQYRGPEGLRRLTEAVRAAMGVEAADLASARKRLTDERRQLEATIANLLDNVTAGTRDLVEERLVSLRRQRQLADARHEELELLAARQDAVQEQVRELGRFVDGLEFTLQHGLNTEKMGALRRCVAQVVVDRGAGRVRVRLRALPGGADEHAAECEVVLSAESVVQS